MNLDKMTCQNNSERRDVKFKAILRKMRKYFKNSLRELTHSNKKKRKVHEDNLEQII